MITVYKDKNHGYYAKLFSRVLGADEGPTDHGWTDQSQYVISQTRWEKTPEDALAQLKRNAETARRAAKKRVVVMQQKIEVDETLIDEIDNIDFSEYTIKARY